MLSPGSTQIDLDEARGHGVEAEIARYLERRGHRSEVLLDLPGDGDVTGDEIVAQAFHPEASCTVESKLIHLQGERRGGGGGQGRPDRDERPGEGLIGDFHAPRDASISLQHGDAGGTIQEVVRRRQGMAAHVDGAQEMVDLGDGLGRI